MKKVLVAAFALISISASAQKETILVGGNVHFENTKTPSTPNDDKLSEFYILPTLGYQFNNNWTAGVVASIGSAKHTSSTNVETKYTAFGAGPFVRYTQGLSNIFSWYGQLQGVFGSAKQNGTKTQSSSQIDLFPAAFINLKNNFGLNFDFGGISYNSTKPTGSDAINKFSIDFGKTINIGISKNFGTGKKK